MGLVSLTAQPKLIQEVPMTRRTVFAGSAAGRRRERRANIQSKESCSSETLHRPTESRVVLSCKRQAMSRVDKAVETETEYRKQIIAAASKYTGPDIDSGAQCLPDVALYAAGYRNCRKDATHIVK